jgi:hypothetical protein
MDRAIERQRGHWSRIEEEAEQVHTPTKPQTQPQAQTQMPLVEGSEKKGEKEREKEGLGGIWRRLGLGRKTLALSTSVGSLRGREEDRGRDRRASLFLD